jgi:hypothetical protein
VGKPIIPVTPGKPENQGRRAENSILVWEVNKHGEGFS